ncbi:MAG: hypothetical protein V1896_02075 [Candidatus Zambryskibacteria bacterium]
MKNFKNKRTAILAIILLGLLILAYKMMFAPTDEELLVDENIIASERVEKILRDIENINFDTSIIENQNFKSLKSIEIPMISLPVGRENPFSGVLKSN